MKKRTILDVISAKNNRKLVCTTAYTYPIARLVSKADFDIILVGDSLGMEIQGNKSTISVTLEDILYHTKCVVRGNESCFIISDMPFLTTEVSIPDSIKNAGLLIQQGGADAVKIEGGKEKTEVIKTIVNAGIPVMAHIGLNPQKILRLGKYTVQGKKPDEEKNLIDDAVALEKSGAFAIVLECVPPKLAKTISDTVSIPTIGIGAGVYCDGQILVSNDIFGLHEDFKPKFVKNYANVAKVVNEALNSYKKEVEESIFPDKEHSY